LGILPGLSQLSALGTDLSHIGRSIPANKIVELEDELKNAIYRYKEICVYKSRVSHVYGREEGESREEENWHGLERHLENNTHHGERKCQCQSCVRTPV
jgi:hypothetical protein